MVLCHIGTTAVLAAAARQQQCCPMIVASTACHDGNLSTVTHGAQQGAVHVAFLWHSQHTPRLPHVHGNVAAAA
jgi:hypothetical protein